MTMDFKKYENLVEFPISFNMLVRCLNSECVKEYNVFQADKFCSKCGSSLEHLVDARKRFEEDKANYFEQERVLQQMFRVDALQELGIYGHPKANKAFDLAWDNGHGSGYSEVFTLLRDYAELIK